MFLLRVGTVVLNRPGFGYHESDPVRTVDSIEVAKLRAVRITAPTLGRCRAFIACVTVVGTIHSNHTRIGLCDRVRVPPLPR